MKSVFINLFLFLLIIIFTYHSWIVSGVLIGGDLHYVYQPMMKDYFLMPFAWRWNFGIGLGGFSGDLNWINLVGSIPIVVLGKLAGFSWSIIERSYFFAFLFFSSASIFLLYRKIFGQVKFIIFSLIIFTCNTYILMLIGGGQVGLALGYSLVPLFMYYLFKLSGLINTSVKIITFIKTNSITLLSYSLVYSLLILFDIRFFFMAIFSLIIYFIFLFVFEKFWRNPSGIAHYFFWTTIFPGVISLFLHSFWVIPTIFTKIDLNNQLGVGSSISDTLRFLSFSHFEQAISLLHPNWPENIFGKTYFMRPEFLFIPVLAYSSIFFISKKNKSHRIILYFCLLSLISVFLAKGMNDPFGGIYFWFFVHIPGFNLFRDSTKWYAITAVCYAIIIPFSIENIYKFITDYSKKNFSKIKNTLGLFFIVTCIGYLMFLISPTITGRLSGTLHPISVPHDYEKLVNYLYSDNKFYRTFWIPVPGNLSYTSVNHPAISAETFLNSTNVEETIEFLRKPLAQNILSQSAVKYIIIPDDNLGQIFITDRKYDESLYQKTISEVDQIPWLTRINGFGRIAVYSLGNPKDHFFMGNGNSQEKISYTYLNQTSYIVKISNGRIGDRLVFSESYDPNWILKYGSKKINSKQFNGLLNSFVLPADGNYSFIIFYSSQDLVDIGTIISFCSLILIVLLIFGIMTLYKIENPPVN